MLAEKTNSCAEKKLASMTLTLLNMETCDAGRDEWVHCRNPEYGNSAAYEREGLYWSTDNTTNSPFFGSVLCVHTGLVFPDHWNGVCRRP